MKKHMLKVVAVAAAATMVVSACGGNDSGGEGDGGGSGGGEVTLGFTWWGNDDRASRYEEAIALFEEEHPDITIQPTWVDWEGYWTQRATEAAGRSLPDVMQFDLSYLAEYSQNGHLLDLAPYIGEQIDLSGFEEALVSSGELNGEQIGIPTSTNTLALFINPNIVEEAGVEPLPEDYTWQDYNAWIRAITEAGLTAESGQPVYGSGDYTGVFWLFLQWLVQNGTEPFTDEGGLNFTQDDVVEFLSLTADLRESNLLFPTERATQLDPLGGFTALEAASEYSWDNFLAGYVADSGVENLEMRPMPVGPEGARSMFWKPSMLLSVGANSEHPEEAATFINFLLTNPEVGKIFGTSKGVPADQAQREAMELEEGSIDARVVAYEEAVTEHVTEPAPTPVKGFGAIEAEWLRLAEELNYGNITMEQFADQWFTEAEMAMQ
ncbi:extracellular solute-binding protein [Georgenia halophila]|uniref:Extracellular solute-binding protein n=1 Tax=Georgenia halophila TaxID=620889 RepID=A0ABP8LFA3_9MICO